MKINLSKLLKEPEYTNEQKLTTGYNYRNSDRSNLTDPSPFLYISLRKQIQWLDDSQIKIIVKKR